VWNICNNQINTLATYVGKNNWNIENKSLQHTRTTIATYATSCSTFATSTWNTCNIHMKHLKHLKHTLATCIFSAQCPLATWMNRGARRRRAPRRGPARRTGRAPTRRLGWAPTRGAWAPCASICSTISRRAPAWQLEPAHPWRAPAGRLSGKRRRPRRANAAVQAGGAAELNAEVRWSGG
jgi:hypothetical protein